MLRRFRDAALVASCADGGEVRDKVERSAGVQVPDHPVGALDVIGGRIPGVDFDDPHLRQ